MTRKKLILGSGLLAILISIVIWWQVHSSPFVFYGKVIDENGLPIAGATVSATVLDGKDYPTMYSATSGKDGLFAVECARGSEFAVSVSEPAHNLVQGWKGHPNSMQHFFRDPTAYGQYVPRADQPVVFSLKKRGNVEPLTPIGKVMTSNMTTVDLTLNTTTRVPFYEERVESGRGIFVRFLTPNGKVRNEENIYSWACEITAPDGVVFDSPAASDFVAPENGYTESIVIDYPETMPAVDWRTTCEKTVFVRYNDGVHARLSVFVGANRQSVRVSGYLNPKPNSRSLELAVAP